MRNGSAAWVVVIGVVLAVLGLAAWRQQQISQIEAEFAASDLPVG